jgi:hypothetical protein
MKGGIGIFQNVFSSKGNFMKIFSLTFTLSSVRGWIPTGYFHIARQMFLFEIRYVNIQVIPLRKCESFETAVKDSKNGCLLLSWKATRGKRNVDGVNEITFTRVYRDKAWQFEWTSAGFNLSTSSWNTSIAVVFILWSCSLWHRAVW